MGGMGTSWATVSFYDPENLGDTGPHRANPLRTGGFLAELKKSVAARPTQAAAQPSRHAPLPSEPLQWQLTSKLMLAGGFRAAPL